MCEFEMLLQTTQNGRHITYRELIPRINTDEYLDFKGVRPQTPATSPITKKSLQEFADWLSIKGITYSYLCANEIHSLCITNSNPEDLVMFSVTGSDPCLAAYTLLNRIRQNITDRDCVEECDGFETHCTQSRLQRALSTYNP